MIHHIFDMSTASILEVRVVVRSMAGLSMGIYYFINQKNQKIYVGSTLNFYNRLSDYLKNTNQVIIKALTKYGLTSFTLILVFMPSFYATKKEVLALEQEILDT